MSGSPVFYNIRVLHNKQKYNLLRDSFNVAIVNGSYKFRLRKIAIIKLNVSEV